MADAQQQPTTNPSGAPITSGQPATSTPSTPAQPASTNPLPSWLSNAWVLALAPALGYLLTFAYEHGCLRPFNIPVEVIQPDFTTALKFSYYVIVVGSCLFLLGHLIAIILTDFLPEKQRSAVIVLCSRYGIWTLLLLFIIVTFGWDWKHLLNVLVPFATAIFVDILMVWFREKGKTIIDGIREGAKLEMGLGLNKYMRASPSNLVFLSLVLICAVGIVQQFGQMVSRKTFVWWVPDHHTNSVVVRIYGSKAVCVPFNPTNKLVERTFFVLSMAADSTNKFTLRHTGRLGFHKGEPEAEPVIRNQATNQAAPSTNLAVPRK